MTHPTCRSLTTPVIQETIPTTSLLLKLTTIEGMSKKVVEEAIVNLGNIFIQYREWSDPLSLKLHEQGIRIFTDLESIFDLTKTSLAKTIAEFTKKYLDELNNLLCNSLDKAPLKEPMLDGEWIWEKSILTQYQILSQISPFTNKPFTAVSHDFAKELIAWRNSVFPGMNTSTSDLVLMHAPMQSPFFFTSTSLTIPVSNDPQYIAMIQKVQRAYFQQIACLRKNERTSLELAERAKKLNEQTEQLIPMMQERIQTGLQQAKKYAETLEKTFQKQLETYDATRKQENQVIQARLDTRTEQVENLNQRCETLDQKISLQEQQLQQQTNEISSLQNQLAHAMNQLNNDSGGCTIL